MAAVLRWVGDDEEPTPARVRLPKPKLQPGELPPAVASTIWRGNELGSPVMAVLSSGFAELDSHLPGGGWPCHSLTEVLRAQPCVMEWRLLAPAMRQVVANRQDIVLVSPPRSPHLPGLQHFGIDERRLVWVQTKTTAERLWVTEQLAKANAAGLLVSWLPQRPATSALSTGGVNPTLMTQVRRMPDPLKRLGANARLFNQNSP